MQDTPIIRQYQYSDKADVINLFKLNTPKYFSPEEEPDLVYYLENEIEHYYVLEINKQIVGSGGFNFSGDKTIGKLSWDIVHPDFQGRSLGSKLLNFRIEKLKTIKEVQKINVRTSQFAYKFYEKADFKLIDVVEDYWASGFDLYNMEYHNFKTN